MTTWDELYDIEECCCIGSVFLIKDFSNKNNLKYCDRCGQIYSTEDVDKDFKSKSNGNYCGDCI